VVQVSGGALARKSSVNPPKKIKSELAGNKGSTQFSEQGPLPCSFFCSDQAPLPNALGWAGTASPLRVWSSAHEQHLNALQAFIVFDAYCRAPWWAPHVLLPQGQHLSRWNWNPPLSARLGAYDCNAQHPAV